jgi:hypothetical protein
MDAVLPLAVKPACRTLARYDEQDRAPERLNPRPVREAGVVVRRISGRPRVGNITTDIDP